MEQTHSEKRKYYRHPITVPILIHQLSETDPNTSESINVSQGGLSFLWTRRLTKGTSLAVTIPVKEKLFEIKVQVAYCRKDDQTGLFQLGVAFIDYASAFQAKLAEEAIEILEYRKKLTLEFGHDVSEEEAARKWILRYAEFFPKF